MAVSIEERLARLEGAYEQIDRRLGNLEQQVADLRREMRTQFYVLLSFGAATFGALLSAVLTSR